jgi:hypothetical protein
MMVVLMGWDFLGQLRLPGRPLDFTPILPLTIGRMILPTTNVERPQLRGWTGWGRVGHLCSYVYSRITQVRGICSSVLLCKGGVSEVA